MKLSAIIALAFSLSAIARPLETSEPSGTGITASLLRRDERGSTVGKLFPRDPPDTNPSTSPRSNDDVTDAFKKRMSKLDTKLHEVKNALHLDPGNRVLRDKFKTLRSEYDAAESEYLRASQSNKHGQYVAAQKDFDMKDEARNRLPDDEVVKADFESAENRRNDAYEDSAAAVGRTRDHWSRNPLLRPYGGERKKRRKSI